MNILILGAGAVGLCVAARLSEVAFVHAVCRERHARAIAEQGLAMSGRWGDGHWRFGAATEPGEHAWDYCIITAKSYHTRALCEQYAEILRGRPVVSLQNGVGNEEIIAEFTDSVIGGTIITGFEWRGEGAVHVSVEAGPICLGRFPEGIDPGVERLVATFKAAGLSVVATASIRGALWSKVLYNCALNPLGAILGQPYGALADPATWTIIEAVVGEAFAVCRAEGVALPWASAADYLAHLAKVQLPATADHHSSMLQDLERGRPTEIDFINGAVVSRAEQHGIAVPVNHTLTQLIRFRQGRSGDT